MILLLPYNVYILPIELRKYIYSYMITPSARCIIDCKNKHVDEFVNINYDIICAHGFIDTQLYFALDKHWLIFIMSIDLLRNKKMFENFSNHSSINNDSCPKSGHLQSAQTSCSCFPLWALICRCNY